jgi:hypothetical protein
LEACTGMDRDDLVGWGKGVLIMSVVQAIPTFSMSRFKLPRGLCLHINSLIRSFWWGSKKGKRRTHWVSWEVMCSPKADGGLGFRDIELFNIALLARQAWRVLQNPDTLSARVLKSITSRPQTFSVQRWDPTLHRYGGHYWKEEMLLNRG